jgi:hypothetical protein
MTAQIEALRGTKENPMNMLLQATTLERIESDQMRKMIEEAKRNRERLNMAKATRAARRVWYVCLLDGSD